MKNSDEAVCQIGFPHHDYKMVVRLRDNQLHGKAVITNPVGRVVAQFSYKNGNGNGKCKLYYESGSLFFSGYLINGYRDGFGIEYEENGDVMYDGYFTKGMRNYRIFANKTKEGYWNEMCERATIISMCHKDNHGRNDGICYFYTNSAIDHISRWEKGMEVELLHVFNGDIMESYENGVLVYHGPFQQISDTEFIQRKEVEDPNSEEGSSSSPKVRRKKKNPGKMKKVNLEKASSFFHYLAGISFVLLMLFYFATKYSYNQFVAISVGICLILFLIVCVVSAILDCILCSRYYRHLNE